MRTFFITTDDNVNIFCKSTGQGEPLLLVHGAMVDSDFFTECANELAKTYSVILYDRRGYSRSSNALNYTPERQAKDIVCILDQLNLKSVKVVACSVGGLIALKALHEYSNRFSKLLIYETPHLTLTQNAEESIKLKCILEDIAAGNLPRAKNDFLLMLGGSDASGKFMTNEMIQNSWNNGDIFLKYEFSEYCRLTTKELIPQDITEKTKIIVGIGETRDNNFFRCSAGELAKEIKCPVYEFEGYHNSAFEHPVEFSSKICDVFEKT